MNDRFTVHIIVKELLYHIIYHIAKGIKTYSKKYKKILWIGDFNVPFTEANIAAFCNEHKLKALCRLVSNKFSKKF